MLAPGAMRQRGKGRIRRTRRSQQVAEAAARSSQRDRTLVAAAAHLRCSHAPFACTSRLWGASATSWTSAFSALADKRREQPICQKRGPDRAVAAGVQIRIARHGDHAAKPRSRGKLLRCAPVHPGGVGKVMRDPPTAHSGLGHRRGIAHEFIFQSKAVHRSRRKIRQMPDQPMRGDLICVMCNLPFLTPDPMPSKDSSILASRRQIAFGVAKLPISC